MKATSYFIILMMLLIAYVSLDTIEDAFDRVSYLNSLNPIECSLDEPFYFTEVDTWIKK